MTKVQDEEEEVAEGGRVSVPRTLRRSVKSSKREFDKDERREGGLAQLCDRKDEKESKIGGRGQ